MDDAPARLPPPSLDRLSTHIVGLDAVLGGGMLKGDTYLIVGHPGTGKTTLGSQLAFAHAAAGGTAIIATFLTETHDRMLSHLRGLAFADRTVVGQRVHYISLLATLEADGSDEVLELLGQTIRSHGATLLVIDHLGEGAPFPAGFDAALFLHRLQVRSALLGCTTVLLATDSAGISGHADAVIELTQEPSAGRDVRWLRVAKLRGSPSLNGRHRFLIGEQGMVVYPRLEATLSDVQPASLRSAERIPFGVPVLDAMLAGGLLGGSSALLLGTPGGGKTVLGLHFLAEGARRGEPGLIASFQETAQDLTSTADRAGMQLAQHMTSGLVQVLWRPPLELGPDAWAWELLAAVEAHRPKRLIVDAFTDLLHLFADPERQTRFIQALAMELRRQGVTTVFTFEIDTFVGRELAVPVPNVSAAMDAGILLRIVELNSELRRMVSVLKVRQSLFDPAIREFIIGDKGIVVGEPLPAVGLSTGLAVSSSEPR